MGVTLKVNNKKKVFAITWLAIATIGFAFAQQKAATYGTVTTNDSDIDVVEFEELKYPLIAQYAPFESQGVEVVRVNLDDQGNVVQALALSGNDLLLPDCLANAKRWKLRPTASKTAVLVYDLRVQAGQCKSTSSLFTLRPPNLATVIGCFPTEFGRPFQFVHFQQTDMMSDEDMEIVHFDNELKYPPLARQARVQGVVVVQVKLDDKGKVVDAAAVSGAGILIPACLANAKNWHFRPNSQKAAIIVYNFKLVINDPGQFILQPPNFVTVTGAPITVQGMISSGQQN
jgi:TonB family protein